MTPRPAADRRTVPAIGAVLALIVVANLVRTVWIPGLWDFWWNVGFAASVGAVGAAAAMTAEEVGTARSTWASGARLGAIVFAAISGVVVLAALLPFGAEQAADERTAVSAGQMLLRVLVLIPIGTVVVEELVFRGVLLGLARRVASTMRAALAVSVVFGLWHVLPVWDAGGDGRVAEMAGTFVATFVAGLGFAWLRERSGSLIAPAAAHLATNSVTFALAWAVAR